MEKRTVLSGTSMFAYEKINSAHRVEDQNYFSEQNRRSAFIDFRKKGGSGEELGWKIHISLTENNENIDKAWNLIVPILMNHGIEACKVLKIGQILPEYQLGKEITIYDQNSPVNWAQLLQEIDIAFIEHGIRPGYFAINDKVVEGSVYFSCRNDLNEERNYVPAIVAGTHNLTGEHHAFEGLSLSLHPKQLPKPSFPIETQENIKRFYSMLQINIDNIGERISQSFSRISNEVDIFDEQFFAQLKRKYYLSGEDVSGLQTALRRLERIRNIFEEGKLGIAGMDQTRFDHIYSEYRKELEEINAQINSEIEKIKLSSSKKLAPSPTISAPKLQSHQAPPSPSHMDDFDTWMESALAKHTSSSMPTEPEKPSGKPQPAKQLQSSTEVESLEESIEESDEVIIKEEYEQHHPVRLRKRDDSEGPGSSSGSDRSTLAPPSLPTPTATGSSQAGQSTSSRHGETITHHSALPTYAAVSHSLSLQPSIAATHTHISSGQEKMIMAIADATGLSDTAVEQLSSQQIQNIHRILHGSEHGSDRIADLIISGLRSRAITIDQVKDISAETEKELEVTLAGKSTGPNLRLEEIMQALHEVTREDKSPSSTSASINLIHPK